MFLGVFIFPLGIVRGNGVCFQQRKEVGVVKDLIKCIVRALVDHPEQVSVKEIGGNRLSVFELKVAKADTGQVIGKKGRTARAMRTILSAASARANKRSVLEIIE